MPATDPAIPNEDLKQRQVFARAVLSYHAPTFLFSQIRKSLHLPSDSKHGMAFKSLVTKGFVEDMTPDTVREKTYRISDREGLAIFAGLAGALTDEPPLNGTTTPDDGLTAVPPDDPILRAALWGSMRTEIRLLREQVRCLEDEKGRQT